MARPIVAALLLVASCSPAPLPGTGDGGKPPGDLTTLPDADPTLPTEGYVARDCAPNDGAALSLLLYAFPVPECSADPARRSVRFYVYGGTDPVFPINPPATITSTAMRGNGTVTDCPGGRAPCRVTSDFTLTFDTYATGGPATGRYVARFADGAPIAGAFRATWCEVRPPMCG